MDFDSSQHSEGDCSISPKKGKDKKGRGATRMSKIIRTRNIGVKFQVKWNANGLPIGNDSVTMMSYWGTSIRTNVSITISNWKDVPSRLLDALFYDVALTFKVDLKQKAWMLKKANITWTNFKSELSRNWIWTKEGGTT